MLNRLVLGVVIASLAVSVLAAPQCSCCSGAKGKAKAAKSAKAGKNAAMKGGCACCAVKEKDPFLAEAARMMAASEGKKAGTCCCSGKTATRAKAKPAKRAAKK